MTRPAFLHPFARPAAEEFITIVRGEGAAVFDAAGRRYVDALASLWYCNVGHGRTEIADAVAAQLHVLENYNCFDQFTNEPAEAITAELAAMSPVPGARVFLTSSGSEAVDSALKLARLSFSQQGRPEKHVLVGRSNAYHGVTFGGLSLQGIAPNKVGFGPLLDTVHHTGHHDLDEAEALFGEHGDRIAAFIAEPVQGAGGVHPPEPGYLAGLRRLCDEHDALLIFDEVITGFGRLGGWWGADRYGVVPDLVTFAKAVTSGYQPLGGVLVGPRVLGPLEADPTFVLRHGHTYSGHPAACVAATANIAILRDEGLVDRAEPIGRVLGGGLERLCDEGLVAGVRGVGAIWAVDMVDGVSHLAVRDAMFERGVIVRPLGASTIAFCPPLVIGVDDLALCLDALADAIADQA